VSQALRNALDADLERLERGMGGRLGLYAHPLREPERALRRREMEVFPAASTIKVFILLAFLEGVQVGRYALSDERALQAADKVPGSGVLKTLSAGRSYTLRDLVTLMITVSDNTATNMLIERVGVEAVNETCARHGWRGTRLDTPLQKPTSVPAETTPRDLGDFFGRLWRGELLSTELTQLAQSIFAQQQYTEQLGRYLGFDPYSAEVGESDLVIASKSGARRGVRNDAGVITAPAVGSGGLELVISVMTKGCPDKRFYPDNSGLLAVSAASKLVFDYFSETV
jgi:beta-lactamase class A